MGLSVLSTIKRMIPQSVRFRFRRRRNMRDMERNRGRAHQEIFTEIYREKKWGGDVFDSGPGSNEEWGTLYAQEVRSFCDARGYRSIVDLGCGDFRIGSLIAKPPITYAGIDVVPDLIARNQTKFGNVTTNFYCIDITQGALPNGDLVLVREVFQHLSFDAIKATLRNMRGRYRCALVTDVQPVDANSFENIDRPSGAHSRVSLFGSGIHLDRPPFSARNVNVLFEIPYPLFPGFVFRGFTFNP